MSRRKVVKPENLREVTFSAEPGVSRVKSMAWEKVLHNSLAPTFARGLNAEEVWLKMHLACLPGNNRLSLNLTIQQHNSGWKNRLESTLTLCEPEGGPGAPNPRLYFLQSNGVPSDPVPVQILFAMLADILNKGAVKYREEAMVPLETNQLSRPVVPR